MLTFAKMIGWIIIFACCYACGGRGGCPRAQTTPTTPTTPAGKGDGPKPSPCDPPR